MQPIATAAVLETELSAHGVQPIATAAIMETYLSVDGVQPIATEEVMETYLSVDCEQPITTAAVMETDSSADGVLAIKTFLTVEDVMKFLTNFDKFHCISVPPTKPKANQVFLYKTSDAGREGITLQYIYIIG